MDFRGDWTEAAQLWRSAPWRIKVLLVLSGFLSTASLVSLAEVVAKWKGFLLTGVTFYRENITGPVVAGLREWFTLPIRPAWIDYLTVALIVTAALLRTVFVAWKIHRSRRERTALVLLVTFMIAGAGRVLYRSVTAPEVDDPSLLRCAALYAITMLIMSIPPIRAADLVAIVYLAVPPLLVCILAAINAGLA